MFSGAAAFNQNLCGWDVANSGEGYYTITSITEECSDGAICGENGSNTCGTV